MNDLDEIMAAICTAFHVRPMEIRSRSRLHVFCRVRHAFCTLAAQQTDCTLEEVGAYLSGRHHSTVIASMTRHGELVQADEDYRRACIRAVQLLCKSRRARQRQSIYAIHERARQAA